MTEPAPDVVSTGPEGDPSRLGFALRVVGGCLVVAIVIGLVWWAERATDEDDFALPDRLAGLDALDSEAALADIGEDRRGDVRKETREGYQVFIDQLSDQYDGAEALFRSYGTFHEDGTLKEPYVVAEVVRAEADPFVAVPNPPGTPAGASAASLEDHGAVSCLLIQRPDDSAPPVSVACQRVDSDLTVRVSFFQGDDVDGVDEVVDATNEIWEDLS